MFSLCPPTEPGLIVINEGFESYYESLKIPSNWKIHSVKDCRFVRDKLNRTFEDFPNEDYYGVIGDDTIPETPGWDTFLANKAGSKNIAVASQVFIERPAHGAIGGDLARACGWIMCPATKHFYSDDALELIGTEFKCWHYYPEIRIAHHHFSVGLAPWDGVYQDRTDANDQRSFEQWKVNDWPILREKLAPLYS